jgi:FkbM family methyltransferase
MKIRDVGIAVVRTAPWLEPVGRWLYGRLPEVLHDTPTSRLRAHFASEDRVTFVQIGAYDGIAGDPIRPIVLQNDSWWGVLVEPQSDAFARLRRNYVGQSSRLQFLNIAVSDTSGEKTIFCIPEEERKKLGLSEWASEIASFSAAHLTKHFPHATLTARNVETVTFADVASRLPKAHVDVVVIDVEGHEHAIIENIDLERHRVKFIIYEHKHLPDSDRSLIECKLRKHGFTLKAFGRDTIACRSLPAVQERPQLAGDAAC